MVDEIIIRSNRYYGRFSIEQRTSEHDVYIDGEYAARWEKTKNSWWEGIGVIEDIHTWNKERFLFFPKGNSQGNVIPYLNEDELKDKVKIDSALHLLYEQSKESEEIYPKVNLELVISLSN